MRASDWSEDQRDQLSLAGFFPDRTPPTDLMLTHASFYPLICEQIYSAKNLV